MNAPITQPESSVAWIAGVLLRSGGYVVAIDIECGFDESGTHQGSPLVCVAGYIMERDQARNLEKEWNQVLNWSGLPHPLPYFHMTDCAADPGNGVFAGLTKPQRIQVVSQLIGVIKRNTLMGIAATISVSDYQELLAGHPFYPDPYVLVAHVALSAALKFIRANKEVGRVAYFFEAGHESEPQANALMSYMFRMKNLNEAYHYAGHSFVPKIGNPVVQAADLLAWQWLKDRKNQTEGRNRRKDLQSLLVHRHATGHIDRLLLSELAKSREPLIRRFEELLSGKQPS